MPRSNTFKFFELLSTLKLKKLKNSFYLCKKFFNQSALLEHLYLFLIFSLICTVHVPLTLYLHLLIFVYMYLMYRHVDSLSKNKLKL